MMESCSEKKTRRDWTTDTNLRTSSGPGWEHQARALWFLGENVMSEKEEEDLSSCTLSFFISILKDNEWQSIEDRMMEPMTQNHLVQVSSRIIRVVSQLVLQLLAPTLKVHLKPEDESRESDSESKQEPQRRSCRPSSVLLRPVFEDPLRKYFVITEKTLVELLGSSVFQSPVKSVLKDVVRQMNQGLCVLAACPPTAQSQNSPHATRGSEVTSLAIKFLGLLESLADVVDVDFEDRYTFLEKATGEVMSAIADSMASCQERERMSGRILRDLAAKITNRSSGAAELGSRLQQLRHQAGGPATKDTEEVETFRLKSDRDDQSGCLYSKTDICVKPYPLLVSSDKVSSDLTDFHSTSLQVLKGLLAKLLALVSPKSFSLMTSPHNAFLPSLDSVALDILDTVINAVKEICHKKKTTFLQRHKKTKVTEDRVNSAAFEIKATLQDKLQEFFGCYKEDAEGIKEDEMIKAKFKVARLLFNLREKTAECVDTQEDRRYRVQSMNVVVRTLLDQINACSNDSASSTLSRLEFLISQNKLSSFSKLLKKPQSPSSDTNSPTEQVRSFSEAAVKRLLMSILLPPLSWGMGQVILVQSSQSSTAQFAKSAQLYNDIISLYAQVITKQVMSSLSRSSTASRLQLKVKSFLEMVKNDSGALKKKKKKKKKRKNVVHFFQKLPKKLRNKWRKLTTQRDMHSTSSEDTQDESAAVSSSTLRMRRVF